LSTVENDLANEDYPLREFGNLLLRSIDELVVVAVVFMEAYSFWVI